MSLTAQYHGLCSECEQPIIPGQRITQDDGEWRHADCEARAETVRCVCETCFLVHAGACF